MQVSARGARNRSIEISDGDFENIVQIYTGELSKLGVREIRGVYPKDLTRILD